MAFDIILMVNNSEPNRVVKNTKTIRTVTGALRDETSIINPVIKIQIPMASVVNCNYVSIPTFKRFYFVNNIVSVTKDIVEFSCHCDVLMSYAADIKLQRAIVKRQENKWNLYLNDGTFRVYQNPIVVTKEFPTGFTTPHYLLAVAGSAAQA